MLSYLAFVQMLSYLAFVPFFIPVSLGHLPASSQSILPMETQLTTVAPRLTPSAFTWHSYMVRPSILGGPQNLPPKISNSSSDFSLGMFLDNRGELLVPVQGFPPFSAIVYRVFLVR